MILARNLYVLPDDDKQYAIETCRSSESVLKKWFKNKLLTISEFVGCVIIIEYWKEFVRQVGQLPRIIV